MTSPNTEQHTEWEVSQWAGRVWSNTYRQVCVGMSLCSEVKLVVWVRTGSTKHRHSAAGASSTRCNTHTHTHARHLPRWKRWLCGRPLCGSLRGPVEGYCCYLQDKESAGGMPMCTVQYVVTVSATHTHTCTHIYSQVFTHVRYLTRMCVQVLHLFEDFQ